MALELPKTNLFIEHIEWRIGIPSIYDISASEGNVTPYSHSTPVIKPKNDGSLSFQKDFCRGERPRISLFYERKSLEK